MKPIVENRPPIEVLLIEDSPGDVRLTKEAFRERQSVHPFKRCIRRRAGSHGRLSQA